MTCDISAQLALLRKVILLDAAPEQGAECRPCQKRDWMNGLPPVNVMRCQPQVSAPSLKRPACDPARPWGLRWHKSSQARMLPVNPT